MIVIVRRQSTQYGSRAPLHVVSGALVYLVRLIGPIGSMNAAADHQSSSSVPKTCSSVAGFDTGLEACFGAVAAGAAAAAEPLPAA